MSFFKTFLALFKGQIKAHTGQFGEDVVIKKIFDHKKKNGFYVDLGAHHPFLHSNTAFFWLKGWNGINVDGVLFCIGICLTNTVQIFYKIPYAAQDLFVWG